MLKQRLTYVLSLTAWGGALLDICIGALTVLGHAPFHLWPLSLLALAWLCLRLSNVALTARQGFARGFYFGLGYFMAGTYWIGSAFIERGPEFYAIMPPMIIGLGALLALFWALAGGLYVRFMAQKRWALWGWVSCFFLAEYARGHVFGGFPWNLPGYIFKAGSAPSQLASAIGIYGLSALVLIIASLLAQSLRTQRARTPLTVIALMLAGLYGSGIWQLSNAHIETVPDVKFRIVQVPFEQSQKFDPTQARQIVTSFLELSASDDLDDITHIVWPEGAYVGLALEDPSFIEALGQVRKPETGLSPDWLLTSLRRDQFIGPDGTPAAKYYNSMLYISFAPANAPALLAVNDKYRLVPFGEFIPGGEVVERLGARILSTSLGSITPAPQKLLSEVPGLPVFSPQICYEGVFSGLTPRNDTLGRAQWVINQSNDAWFGHSIGPWQHANITAYRAIEEGLPIIRAASNGVSGIIDPYGRFIKKLSPDDRGIVDSFLPKPRLGNIFSPRLNHLYALIFLFLAFMSCVGGQSRYNDKGLSI